MQNLASFDLDVRVCKPGDRREQRLELHIASSDIFVAWFQSIERVNDGELVRSTNTQFITRRELTPEQVAAVHEWQHEQLSASA